MPNFQYVAAKSVDEALSFLAETADSCKIIAGGTDLIPALRNEEIRAAHVLNILDIEELKCIREEQDVVRIGSTVTITEIIHADVLKQYLPILVNAASTVGGPPIRNRGTIGGNICNASPSADLMPVVIALNGELELQSKRGGIRLLPAAEAVVSPYQTRLYPDEILTGIIIEKLPKQTKSAFEMLGQRNAMARSLITMSIVLINGVDETIADLRIVLGAVEAVARRMTTTEQVLLSKKPQEALIDKAVDTLAAEVVGVWISEYKLPVLGKIFKRVLKRAL